MSTDDANSTETAEPASILIVDDDHLVRKLLDHKLTSSGYTVTQAEDGAVALDLINKVKSNQTKFDLVLLDISMPGMDGLKVLSLIRKIYSVGELPVIMATAMDDSSLMVWAMRLGANDYLTKPFDMTVVKSRVKAQLRIKQVVDDLAEREKQLEERVEDLETTVSQLTAEVDSLKQKQLV